jgi:two-component system, chemotaxis family, protein-glutamate methylesterase/glutaminase
MANRDIVAIGTSAGGVEALLSLTRHLPGDLPACVLVTIHLSSQHRSALDEILSRAGPLKASFAAEGDVVRKGRIYIAPPGCHLLVEGERLALGRGPRENNARPAVDPMLRSAALCCGSRTIGVILTGTLGDGASGLRAVSQAGGITVVQDPRDAAFPEMPRSALERLAPDHVAHLAAIPRLLQELVRQPAGEPIPLPDRIKLEVDIARTGHSGMSEMDGIGRRSTLTCPDCNGVMWEIDEGGIVRYRRQMVANNWADKANDLEREAQLIRDSMRRIDEIAEQRENMFAARATG